MQWKDKQKPNEGEWCFDENSTIDQCNLPAVLVFCFWENMDTACLKYFSSSSSASSEISL